MSEPNNDMKSGCVCHENHEETLAHGCVSHHHSPDLQDTRGARLLFTLALNLIIPTAQIIGGLLAGSVALISDAMHNFSDFTAVLMNATPGHLDLEEVRGFLSDLHGVLGAHYLHAWQVSSASTAFSCHVVVLDQSVSRTEKIAESIRHELFHRFRIDHPVLQFETSACGNGALLCEMSCNAPAPQDKESAKAGSKGESAHAR